MDPGPGEESELCRGLPLSCLLPVGHWAAGVISRWASLKRRERREHSSQILTLKMPVLTEGHPLILATCQQLWAQLPTWVDKSLEGHRRLCRTSPSLPGLLFVQHVASDFIF